VGAVTEQGARHVHRAGVVRDHHREEIDIGVAGGGRRVHGGHHARHGVVHFAGEAHAVCWRAPTRTYTRLMLFLLRSSPEGSFSVPSGICAMNAGRSGSRTSNALHTVWPALGVPGRSSSSFAA